MNDPDTRPDTVAECLEAVADTLDVEDAAINMFAELTEQPSPIKGDNMQIDLRALAKWLHEHPDVDTQMQTCLSEETRS